MNEKNEAVEIFQWDSVDCQWCQWVWIIVSVLVMVMTTGKVLRKTQSSSNNEDDSTICEEVLL